MTTLSTVGFGDYYPVSDEERIVCSFVLLFGVMLFSIFMGQLIDMIYKLDNLDDDFNQDDELEKFFLMFRDQFNYGKPLNRKIEMDITNHFNFMWKNNRNNFLLADSALVIFK